MKFPESHRQRTWIGRYILTRLGHLIPRLITSGLNTGLSSAWTGGSSGSLHVGIDHRENWLTWLAPGTCIAPAKPGPFPTNDSESPFLYLEGKMNDSSKSARAFSSDATTRKMSLMESIPWNPCRSSNTMRW